MIAFRLSQTAQLLLEKSYLNIAAATAEGCRGTATV